MENSTITNEELQAKVKNLETQLKKQEKMASLGMLSAGIAHELQNPLNFVINFSKISIQLIADLQDAIDNLRVSISAEEASDIKEMMGDIHENMNKIIENGNRATSIIRGILLSSRGKEDEFIPTDISMLVHEYVWLSYHAMRANYKNFNIAVQENYEKELPKADVVPQDFSRAVLNIVNNACYAVWKRIQGTHDTGYKPSVAINLCQKGDNLVLSIRDNGIGMSEEVKNKIYDNFFTTKPVGQGTGLGMGIVKQIIVDKHKGKIEVESVEGDHTIFILTFPFKTQK